MSSELDPNVIMISTEYPQIPGGVGRYTSNLVNSLKKMGVEVYVLCNEKGHGDYFGLDPSNQNNSQVILNVIDKLNPDVVHVQLEHGLYGLKQRFRNKSSKSITNIEYFYEKCPIPIITTFHSAYPFRQWLKLSKLLYNQENYTNTNSINPFKKINEFMVSLSTYYEFKKSNKNKMKKSSSNIVFSDYLGHLISNGIVMTKSISKKNNLFVVYHGAEPTLPVPLERKLARKKFNLPVDNKIGLLFGFATDTKGWDLLGCLNIPHDWIIVINQSKNLYGTKNHSTVTTIEYLDHKIKGYANNGDQKIINLNQSFLTDMDLSILLYSSDVIILPYTVTSGSGVLFDALAHGLPFIATDLGFFKEFEKKGLGITVKRKPGEFEGALKRLEVGYSEYVQKVEEFKPELIWNNIARQHLKIYINSILDRKIGNV
jgi:glycosyltransferase involved in cell wall biosynthesis